MDGSRFDALARCLSSGSSRRGVLAGLAAGLLAALAWRSPDVAGEARRKRRRRRRKRNGNRSDRCVPDCAGKQCGPDGCGGSCGPCLGGACPNGACVCPSDRTNCGGICVDLGADPRNCGSCGARCQLNAVCAEGSCTCELCGSGPELTCCPPGGSTVCHCFDSGDAQGRFADPTNAVSCTIVDCPEARQCVGPVCQACCPAGSRCDRSTGTCLQ